MSASKEEIREAMKILWDIDAEDVDQAVGVERLYGIECGELIDSSQCTHHFNSVSGHAFVVVAMVCGIHKFIIIVIVVVLGDHLRVLCNST
jgi:hypothetical protein